MPTSSSGSFSIPANLSQDDQRYLISAPAAETISWDNIPINFRPLIGSTLYYYEQYTLLFTVTNPEATAYRWNERYAQEAFGGHWQLINRNGETQNEAIERGQLILTSGNNGIFSWVTKRLKSITWSPDRADEYAAYLGLIQSCNSDLAPAAVQNKFVDSSNVDSFIQIVYALSTGDFANAAQLYDKLTQPFINGYKFTGDIVFKTLENVPTIDLKDAFLNPQLDNLGIWLHPDFSLSAASWGCDFSQNYNLEIFNNQFPNDTECTTSDGTNFPQ
jgi:hypothetical protein